VRSISAGKKVVFVCGFAWQPKGTARFRAFPLAAELVKKGYAVTILLTPYDNPVQSGEQRELHGVQIRNLDVGTRPGLRDVPSIVRKLCTAIRGLSPDIVHTFKPKGYAGAACTWLLMKGFRSIVLDCDDWEGWGGWNDVKNYPWLVKEYISRQEKWLIRRVPVVTTASLELQRRAADIRKSPKNVFYIPNCVGSPETEMAQRHALSLSGEEAKRSFGLPPAPVIFYSGHFDVGGEIMFFSRSAARAARESGATIVVVGEGPALPQMKKYFAQQDGVQTRFFSRLPYDRFVELLAATDVAAFPYPDDAIHQAKCSARIVDYMSMGKAVLSTSVGQNNDYIVSGESGILTRPGQEEDFALALQQLIANADLRGRLGRNAQEQIRKNYCWSGEPINNCLRAYNQLSLRDP
jgi:glycosyltransferase involved in cell wall biosynthesis